MDDSFIINKTENQLSIIPDGKFGSISGNIKDVDGNPIAGCLIKIDGDTSVITNASGDFAITLPYRMQKEQYILFVIKEKFKPQKHDYFAGSGNIDIRLKK